MRSPLILLYLARMVRTSSPPLRTVPRGSGTQRRGGKSPHSRDIGIPLILRYSARTVRASSPPLTTVRRGSGTQRRDGKLPHSRGRKSLSFPPPIVRTGRAYL